jgi:GTP cyclohydrolase I
MASQYALPAETTLRDVQNLGDERGLAIDYVGVSDLRYPIVVLDRKAESQHTVASISLSVGLPHCFKGTHMSRFIEVLHEHRGEVTVRTMPVILRALRERLEAETARVEVRFPYFIEKEAPVTGARGLMDYECAFKAEANGSLHDFVVEVRVPVTSLCPCSKAISDYGAHNQRGLITIEVRSAPASEIVWIEELVAVAERAGSAPVYPLLKRADERHVTMQAYDNPVFVEDMVRGVAARLLEDPRITWFSVEAVNAESIHNHAAFARLERRREPQKSPEDQL